jgi:transposase
MTQDDEHRRQQAVALYLAGDNIDDICPQLTCSKSWLYKWKARYQADDPSWAQQQSRRPSTQATQTPECIEQAVVELRQTLAQTGGRNGAVAIQQALRQQGIEPMPSHRTIYRILQRYDKKGTSTHSRLEGGHVSGTW